LDERADVAEEGVLYLRVAQRSSDEWVEEEEFVEKTKNWGSRCSWYYDGFWAVAVDAGAQLQTDA
jgi:hypothetical protein